MELSFIRTDADRHAELSGSPLKSKSTRKPLACIIGYLEIHPSKKPNVIRSTPSLQTATTKRMLTTPNHMSLSILGKRNYSHHNGLDEDALGPSYHPLLGSDALVSQQTFHSAAEGQVTAFFVSVFINMGTLKNNFCCVVMQTEEASTGDMLLTFFWDDMAFVPRVLLKQNLVYRGSQSNSLRKDVSS
ncbi:hypothetical protein MC885_011712 [Smutsia gigantea]|nr:hypothetical protein MC885_011712 [Smutsia gigantea]